MYTHIKLARFSHCLLNDQSAGLVDEIVTGNGTEDHMMLVVWCLTKFMLTTNLSESVQSNSYIGYIGLTGYIKRVHLVIYPRINSYGS